MEIKFKRDTAFRKQFFVPDSFAHPAKMDAQLLIWIVEHYTQVGETILDPMAGSGTMMLACTLGRSVVLVELESKFCKMMRDNWEEVRMRPQLGYQMGNCQIIRGDARQLEGLVDKIVTSPPYAESKEMHDPDFMINTAGDLSKAVKEGKIKGHAFSQEARERAYIKRKDGLPENPDNISNLPYGEIDKCIFSPPYAGGEQFHDLKWIESERKRPHNPEQKQNLSNLPYGQIDKIVTSPPYSESVQSSRHSDSGPNQRRDRLIKAGYDPKKYQLGRGRNCQVIWEYGKGKNNIGNLDSQSYLEAMLQVYQQCYKVLKPRGLMILVTKNFIRNKQIVRLDEDTIKLCEQAGFSFVERHYRKLPSQSFWRVIYHQRHPEVEQILNEDVLVFSRH